MDLAWQLVMGLALSSSPAQHDSGVHALASDRLSTSETEASTVATAIIRRGTPALPAGLPEANRTLTPTDASASELRLMQAIRDNKSSWLERLLPAILGFAGVFVGSAINARSQSKQRASAERANRADAAFGAQTKIIEYRSQQAHEFYYPLFLSLQRSSGIRRQLCDHLNAKDPLRFDFRHEDDGKDHLFIYDAGSSSPIRFRLIEAMHELATQHPETLPMVNDIVDIGEQMSTLIHEKGGLVLATSETLTQVLGRYLAHFSILREVSQKAKVPHTLVGIRYNVLYPNNLEELLQTDIAFLQMSIARWSEFSAELWDANMPDVKMPVLTPSPNLPPQS
ncbi:hypothetical protein [Stenotrophomonas sp. CFBP8980]|uniref:hypothetical protein n=1 Tax=Stenotrophomonas sp. CFBP8980 TaxID=3096523 RepID=UPI002A6AC1B2|nr:hypothetical protein [Stenotrophomonas sp. CFBP8980]MDY1032457.1 hypothetical protein [Stenotrophomonas sp. CFBP8980]